MKPNINQINLDRMGTVLMLAMVEILGQDGTNHILNLAQLQIHLDLDTLGDQDYILPIKSLSQIQVALENTYGSRAGRGISMRVGRTCLKYALREYGSALGVTDLSFRLLPLHSRIQSGCEALAGLINGSTDLHVTLEVNGSHISWHFGACPVCWDRVSDGPCCTLAVGFLQEVFSWMSGGKYYMVEEKTCIARGDETCTVVIDRTPISG
jgi:predicted hydrocarbon binding protein